MKTEILQEQGLLYASTSLTVRHKLLEAQELIQPHRHVDEEIFMSVVKGKLELRLQKELEDEPDKYILEPGVLAHFDGKNYISACALEDTDIFIYLERR